MTLQEMQLCKHVSVNIYVVILGQLEVELVEHVLANSHSHHATKQKVQIRKAE